MFKLAQSTTVRWAITLAPGFALGLLPLGFTSEQQRLLAVFVSTILSLVVQPLPMGACSLLAMTTLFLSGALPGVKVLAGFGNPTVWLIFSAFLFARAVIGTGFGLRIAYLFVRRFGAGPLSLAYSVSAANVVLAPFVPSDTARGGGVIYPIVRSLAEALGSKPQTASAAMGTFIVLSGFHANYTASAMFLTSMVANPMIAGFASSIAKVELSWTHWATASLVPALCSLAFGPILFYRIVKPGFTAMITVRSLSEDQLKAMGPLSRRERWLILILVSVMAGWITSGWHGFHNAFVALAGVSAVLVCQVLTWDDFLGEKNAWDAMIWFAPLLTMAEELNRTGVIDRLSNALLGGLHGLSWQVTTAALVLCYLYLHYGFASMTAHATALYPGFLAAGLAAGSPPALIALLLAFFSNLNAGLTHYGTGSAPVFFGAGFVSQTLWWRVGFLMSLANVVIWLGIGAVWWKLLGIW
jgi:DASS family divalent anion:Na+ symporter